MELVNSAQTTQNQMMVSPMASNAFLNNAVQHKYWPPLQIVRLVVIIQDQMTQEQIASKTHVLKLKFERCLEHVKSAIHTQNLIKMVHIVFLMRLQTEHRNHKYKKCNHILVQSLIGKCTNQILSKQWMWKRTSLIWIDMHLQEAS